MLIVDIRTRLRHCVKGGKQHVFSRQSVIARPILFPSAVLVIIRRQRSIIGVSKHGDLDLPASVSLVAAHLTAHISLLMTTKLHCDVVLGMGIKIL